MTNVFLAIMKKEFLPSLRFSKISVLLAISFPTFLQITLLGKYQHLARSLVGQDPGMDHILQMAPTISLFYVAPVLIPFLANALLIKSLVHERASGALLPVLTTGLNVGVLWAAKTLAIYIFCYIVSLLLLVADILMMVYYFKLRVVISLASVVVTMIVSPLTALAITAILSFLYWTVGFGNILGSFLPMGMALGLFYYGVSNPSGIALLDGVAVIILAVGMILFLCGFIISKISRARILGLT